MSEVKIGDKIEFTGYIGSDKKGQSKALTLGDTYEVVGIDDQVPDDLCFKVVADNPDYTGKRGSKKTVEVEVFHDECTPLSEDATEVEKEEVVDTVGGASDTEEVNDFVEPADAVKGTIYEVQMKDESVPIFAGTCTRVTKTLIHIDDEKYKKADVDVLFLPENSQDTVDDKVEDDKSEPVAAEESGQEMVDDDTKEDTREAESEEKRPTTKKKATTKKKSATKTAEPAKSVDVPKDKGTDALTTDSEDQDIVTMVDEAEDICELARECVEDSAMTDYRLAGILCHVAESKAYEGLSTTYTGKGGFSRYCVNDLGVHYRKACYLIDIYVIFNNTGLGSNDLTRIGWTKARHLVKVLTKDNTEEMLALAESNTVDSLIKAIKEMQEMDGTEDSSTDIPATGKKMSMKFNYYADDSDFLIGVLTQTMDEISVDTEEEALYHIVTRYAAELLNT